MTNNNPLVTTHDAGQSLWLDFIQRSMLQNGELQRLIEQDRIAGLTSNPAIFKQAIAGTDEYDSDIRQADKDTSDMDVYAGLAIADIQAAADIFRPVFESSNGEDGMVSIEVSPSLADDIEGTIAEALDLHKKVGRDNVMIKVPGTKAGIDAFEAITAAGVNVNVTLLFSVFRYQDIVEAYLKGLEQRVARGDSIKGQTSVASFFISRVDSAVDAALPENSNLKGKVAIANAKIAYAHYEEVFRSERFKVLAEAGALPQRLLWASTGTKNPEYSDVLYIEELIGPETVNTVPPATLDAFRDHGTAVSRLKDGLSEALETISQLPALNVELESITEKLEKDGVAAFCVAFDELLESVREKRENLA